jgi:AcrR family transcriptional regulator
MASPRRRGRPATKLSRDRVLDAAVALARESGTAAISFRQLAERLEVSPMSLYRHVRSHTDLLVAVVDRLLERDPPPRPPPRRQWRAHIRWAGHYMLHVLTAYPGVRAAFMAEPVPSRHLVTVFERLLDSLVAAGCEPDLAADVDFALLNLVAGFAGFEEGYQKRFRSPAQRLKVLRTEVDLPAEKFPRIALVADRVAAFNERAQFDRNLDVIVRGVESIIRSARRPSSARS